MPIFWTARIVKMKRGRDLYNPGDVSPGMAGAELGAMLRTKDKKTSDVGPWIRDHICNPNPKP